jgi:hypothetical protein
MSGISLISLQLVKTFAIRRTKAKVDPPTAVPQITETHA